MSRDRARQGEPSTDAPPPALREAMIREAAYFLYEREGRRDDRALEHWLAAEAAVDAAIAAAAVTAAPPPDRPAGADPPGALSGASPGRRRRAPKTAPAAPAAPGAPSATTAPSAPIRPPTRARRAPAS